MRMDFDADPLVSIVIPCYRASRFIGEALQSVGMQEGVAFEVIVVDDGSPDGPALRDAVAAGGSARVRLLVEPHRGLAATRNAGIAEARGPLVAFLDADDGWTSGFLRAQVDLLRHTGADLVYSDASFFGSPDYEGSTVMTWNPSAPEVSMESVLAGTSLPVMSTIVARTDAVRDAGGFDPSLAYCEDFDLWVRMLRDGSTFAWSPEARARRRIHDANLSRDTQQMAEAQIGVIGRYLDEVASRHPLRPAIAQRLRRLGGEIQLAQATAAILAGDASEGRRALWGFVRSGGGPKHAAAALALTLAPRLTLPLLRRRIQ